MRVGDKRDNDSTILGVSSERHADEGLWDILIKDIPKEVTSYTLNLDMLREGVTYDFRVIAVNDYGYGSPSAPSPSIAGEEIFSRTFNMSTLVTKRLIVYISSPESVALL